MSGVRVSGDASATYLVAATWDLTSLLSVTPSGATVVSGFDLHGMPVDLHDDAQGRLLVVADETSADGKEGGLRAQLGAPGSFTSYLIDDPLDRAAPFSDVSIAPDGTARVWFVQDILDGPPWRTYAVAVLGPNGTTSVTPQPIPADTEWVHFGVAVDGAPIAFGVNAAPQLLALEPQGERLLGAGSSYRVARLPSDAGAETVPYAVALQDQSGIRVVVPAAGPGSVELPVPGTEPLVASCEGGTDPMSCPGPCHETAIGVEPGAFAIARTAGDVAWVAFAVTRRDDVLAYELNCIDGGTFCQCIELIQEDHTTSELVVVKVPLLGGAPEEVLRVPAGALNWFNMSSDDRIVDIASAGEDILLAARLRDGKESKIRVLRVTPGP